MSNNALQNITLQKQCRNLSMNSSIPHCGTTSLK